MVLNSLRIGSRLAIGFGIVIAIGVLSTLINNHSLSTANRVALQIKDKNFSYALLAEEMAYHTEAVQQYLTDVGATRDPEAFAEAEAAARAFHEGVARFREAFQAVNDDDALGKLEAIEENFDRFYAQGKLMAWAYVNDGTAAGNAIMRAFDASSDRIATQVREFKAAQRAEANLLLQELDASLDRTRKLLWTLTLCTALLGVLVSWLITRSITQPLTAVVTFSSNVADGDLSKNLAVRGGGEIGEMTSALNAMVESLKRLFGNIKGSSGGLSQISGNISDASKQVTRAAATQAEGVENTSSAITEINSSIRGVAERIDSLAKFAAESSASAMEMAASVEQVAQNVETFASSTEGVSASIMETAAAARQIDGSAVTLKEAYTSTAASVTRMDESIRKVEKNAREASVISGAVLKDAETGQAAVEATSAGIDEIKRASAITSEVIANLSARADQIGFTLSVIDEVSEQINLLALNAAIIAAQAGQHGKGFAVVAEEIKSLAMRTVNSSREIAEVIEGVQGETRRAVTAIAEAEACIASGEQLSIQSNDALSKIVSGMKKASGQVDEIAGITVDQAKGSQVIREAMSQVAEMVDQIVRATSEQRKGSELIMAELDRMRELTTQVRGSTREQSQTGSHLATRAHEIAETIQQIRLACIEQSRGSEQIVRAVENIRESAAGNLASIRVMEDAVAGLSGQIGVLDEEVAGFKLS